MCTQYCTCTYVNSHSIAKDINVTFVLLKLIIADVGNSSNLYETSKTCHNML